MTKKVSKDVVQFVVEFIDGIELDGLCPICKTGRSQNGECWNGHIVINVKRNKNPEFPTYYDSQGREHAEF